MDLLRMAEQDVTLKRVSSHRGGEFHGPCPVCGGRDRLRVQPEQGFWRCRQCNKSGDEIAYAVWTGRMTTAEAYQARRGGEVKVKGPGPGPRVAGVPEVCDPPGEVWQARAWEFTAAAQESLWGTDGARALSWLRERGLSDATIEGAGLGYYGGDPEREPPGAWGLPDDHTQIWLPRGVTIPWFIGPDLWRVNIRRPVGKPKYIGPAGFKNGLYQADQVRPGRAVILVEGEFDALLLSQEAGDLVAPVATGSAGGARRARWAAALALAEQVLVTFDDDRAGQEAREYWLRVLPGARVWRPAFGDTGDLFSAGVDLRGWVQAGLGDAPAGLTFTIPPGRAALPGLALPDGAWQRMADGSIEVVFSDRAALRVFLDATAAIRRGAEVAGVG